MYLSEEGSSKVHFTSLLGLSSLLIFTILAALVSDGAFSAYTSLILIPLYLAILSIPVVIQLTFSHAGKEINPLSVRLALISLYSIAVALCLTLFLQGLNDDVMDVAWSVTLIPFWCGLGVYLVLIVFLYPGLTSEQLRMKREACLFFVYFLGLLLTSIFTALKLDTSSIDLWTEVYSPLWTAFLLHLLSFFFLAKREVELVSPSEFPKNELILLVLISTFTALLAVKGDAGGVPGSVVLIPIWVLVAYGFFIEVKDYRRELRKE